MIQRAGWAATISAGAPTGTCGAAGGPGCILVCSGDQNVTLAPGACTYVQI